MHLMFYSKNYFRFDFNYCINLFDVIIIEIKEELINQLNIGHLLPKSLSCKLGRRQDSFEMSNYIISLY
jgi:hypothetical protein